jgi:catechol 2,3-dioxygenase-like lactoylglutathione lyase family enzyme
MLERLDRIQAVVRDPVPAAEAWYALLGAEPVREEASETLRAHLTVLQAGDTEIELLRPTGPGPAADRLGAWGEGLFGVGFSVADLAAMRERLAAQGARWTEEGERLFVDPDETHGLRVVIGPRFARKPVGHVRWVYEVTHLVKSWKEGTGRHAELFGLDSTRFSEITSELYGYTGMLLLFDPPSRLDRIEICEITDPDRPMGRFFGRRGEGIYMCYCECDDTQAMLERLRSRGVQHTAPRGEVDPPNLFVHPSGLHGVLLGISRTHYAWTWSGRPDLAHGPGG